MIQRSDILSIPFLKKSAYTGSFQGMRYRLEKWKPEEAENESLRVAVWNGPYNYDVTKEEEKECQKICDDLGVTYRIREFEEN